MAPSLPPLPAPEPGVAPYLEDEDLLAGTLTDGLPRLRVRSGPAACVVLGRGSRRSLEVEEDAVAALGLPLLRRRGGGCAVVLDPGNLMISLTVSLDGLGGSPAHFEHISAWLAEGLRRVGLPALHMEGSSDLALGDRKIGGACLYRSRGLLYYSTTLLISADLDLLQRCLRHPPREPAYRAGRRHAAFVRNLLPGLDPGQVPHLAAELRAALPLAPLLAGLSSPSGAAPRHG